MKYEHIVLIVIHLISYSLLYFVCKKKSVLNFGFLVMIQLIGVVIFVHSLIVNDFSLAFRTPLTILFPLLVLYFMRDRPMHIGGKKYAGFGYYLLVIETNLKFILGLFLLSLLINLYFNPLQGLLNYTNLSSIVVFLLSIPFCRKMNKLEESEGKGKKQRG